LAKTKQALERLEEELYVARPETIIVISPHGKLMDEVFTINHSPTLQGDFSGFGDLETKLEFKNDLPLAYQIRERLETDLPLILTTDSKLDYGSSIPLLYLASHLKNIKIIPVGYCQLDRKAHFNFGNEVRKILEMTNKRVAVIASADLSHRLIKEAPAGYSPEGKKFDADLVKYIKEKEIGKILTLDEGLIKEAGECGYRSILILLGLISEINYKADILSYEGPLGVGYLTANFIL